MTLPITSTLAALLALIAVPLTIHISARRALVGMKSGGIHKATFGEAEDLLLRNSIRAFGNFIEYVPLALLLIFLMELQGAQSQLLWWTGGAFVAGRVVHALSMTFIPLVPAPRGVAMLATYATYLIAARWLLINAKL